jgi:Flp pilus assembly protein TadD
MLTKALISGKSAFLLYLFCFNLTGGNLAFAGECKEGVAQAVSVQGRLEVLPAGAATWENAMLGDSFCPGDRLRVGANSRVGLILNNDTLLRLAEHSSVVISAPAEDGTAWLDLMEGIAHFISRVKHAFQVNTPYVNASIEGTEFIVRVKDNATDVTVFEGVVVARNQAGSVKLLPNQTGRAVSKQAPVVIANAKPRDAVAWALYYPPLPEQPGAADVLAQQTVTAITQNNIQEAAELARQSLAADSQSPAAYMAQSYVDQAQFNIPAALANSRKAAELMPQSALTQARLAEVWLMNGEIEAARQTAAKAVSLDPRLSLAHAVLGFSSLREVNLEQARSAFEKAISLNSAAPLPHLGLGLVLIRQGELASGRREIETAVLLDPNNALLRSYLGKAYYEEKRDSLASDQLAMAKALDPNDPTAWFYDSILLLSQNRPVEALAAQQQAIKLNDNRGVYRSRQLLDQDEAARNAASARIYSDLGYEKLAISEAAKALSQAPDNFSAHRFMADINSTQPQRKRAADSELLQSKLLQPLNANTLRPQLSELQLADGPARFSYNEFNPLFTSTGPSLLLDGFVAGNNTWGDDAIASFLHNRFSLSLAQYHYESDGFRDFDWLKKDTKTAFVQFSATPDTMFQAEYSDGNQRNGDLNQHFFSEDDLPEFQEETDKRFHRFGFRHAFSNSSTLLANYASGKTNSHTKLDLLVSASNKQTDDDLEIQWLLNTKLSSFIVGGSHLDQESTVDTIIPFPPFPDIVTTLNADYKYNNIYFYSYTPLTPDIELTLASSYTDDRIERHTTDLLGTLDNSRKNTQFNPKLGVVWNISDRSIIRAAIFRDRPLISSTSTLEPTQIAGFNQIYDDFQNTLITDARRVGVGFDSKINTDLRFGFSALHSDLKGTVYGLTTEDNERFDMNRFLLNAYTYYKIDNNLLLNLEYEYEKYESPETVLLDPRLDSLKTHRVPLTLRYFLSNAFSTSLTSTYYNQKGIYDGTIEGKDDFWIFDASVAYSLPRRLGKISIGAKNLFNTEFNYEDKQNNTFFNPEQSSNINELSSERIVYGKFSIHF